jgi:putative ABC transport system permease protein
MTLGLYAWIADIGAARRRMARARPFLLGVALIVSVGVGAATAMSSLAQATLLREPNFRDADRLVLLWSTRAGEDHQDVSLPDFLDWQRQARSYEQLALVSDWAFSFSVPGAAPTLEYGALVSGGYFPALGVQPLLGRLLRAEDDAPGEPCRLVLPAAVFRARLGANPAWLGNNIELDGKPCELVGVAEEGFDFCYPRHPPVLLWASVRPLWHDYELRARDARDEGSFHVLGKLRSGVSLELAQAELTTLAANIASAHPGHVLGAGVAGLHDELVLALRPRVWGLSAAIGCLFLTCCTNIASLFLVRAQSRRSALALRSALGATRGRLLWQLMLELLVVFAVATPGAWLVARIALAAFTAVATTGLSVGDVSVDARVLFGCLLLSSASGVLFGLGPAWALSRVPLGAALGEAGAGVVGGRHQRRWRGLLVAAQVAAASALLSSSRTAGQAIEALSRRPGGLDAQGLVSVFVSAPLARYPDEAIPGLQERLLAGLRARPGVLSATIASSIPLFGQSFGANVERLTPEPGASAASQEIMATVVRPGFFEMLRIPLLQGRDFGAAERPESQRVVIINETLSASLFPGQSPIGQRLHSDFWKHLEPLVAANDAPAEIIGVVGDVRRYGLQHEAGDQAFFPYSHYLPRTADVIVRLDPAREAVLARQVPSWIREIEPELSIGGARGSTRAYERGMESERMLSRLLSGFATACLALAALGVYAAVSYASAQRTREYAIRSALGASPWNIVWQVTREASSWIAVGLMLGLIAAWALGDIPARQIATGPSYEPLAFAPGFELLAFARAAAIVALAALLACAAPALRALRLVPASALRRE